jgi:hypothetical protein
MKKLYERINACVKSIIFPLTCALPRIIYAHPAIPSPPLPAQLKGHSSLVLRALT